MSLGITVGPLARWVRGGDEQEAELVRRDMEEINGLLGANRLPPHAEPEKLPRLQGRNRFDQMPYSWYARLQRAVAFSRQEQTRYKPARDDEDPLAHPFVRTELNLKDSHLICQGAEGYYVPIGFSYPIFITRRKLRGRIVGSSQAAILELVAVAPLLRIRLAKGKLSDAKAEQINREEGTAHYEERQAWLILFESFRLSVEHKAGVSFH
jgi:hypothetical protein